MKKFPVFSLMIREFDAESISYQTAGSAKQSAILAFSTGKSKILHTFPHYSPPKGPGDGHIPSSSANQARLSLSRIGTVPYTPSSGRIFAWVRL